MYVRKILRCLYQHDNKCADDESSSCLPCSTKAAVAAVGGSLQGSACHYYYIYLMYAVYNMYIQYVCMNVLLAAAVLPSELVDLVTTVPFCS